MLDIKTMQDSLKDIKEQALNAAIVSLIAELVIKGLFVPKRTKIVVDSDIPAELYTLRTSDGPKAVYVTSKKIKRFNLAPAVTCLAVAGVCHYLLKNKMK